jgi:hypothetical protein
MAHSHQVSQSHWSLQGRLTLSPGHRIGGTKHENNPPATRRYHPRHRPISRSGPSNHNSRLSRWYGRRRGFLQRSIRPFESRSCGFWEYWISSRIDGRSLEAKGWKSEIRKGGLDPGYDGYGMGSWDFAHLARHHFCTTSMTDELSMQPSAVISEHCQP